MSRSALRALLAFFVMILLAQPSLAASRGLAGRPLIEVLQELRSGGIELVFTSRVVRPEMMVEREPQATEVRQLLDELLAPHGLELRQGAADILVIVPSRDADHLDRSTIFGLVRSASGPAGLAGASVRLLPDDLETTTGTDGSFLFDDLAPGLYTLIAIRRGFVVERRQVTLGRGQVTEVSFLLAPAPVTEDTVTVTPSKVSLLRRQPEAFFALEREELLALPHLGNDFFRALSLLPGVISNDVSAEFHVRGSRRDETQILLDGQELFDPYHLRDFDNALSAIVPETVSRVDLSTGGFPVEYGDRLAGVLDMTTVRPAGSPRGSVALGVLSAQAGGAGAFHDGEGNWTAQLRRGTTDFAGRIFSTDAPRYWDALGKLEYQIGARQGLRLNLLHTDDKYQIEERIDGDFKSFETHYRSSYAWLTHDLVLGTSTSVESAVSFSRVDRDRNGLEIEDDFQFVVTDFRDMDVLGLRQRWSHRIAEGHVVRGGFELRDFDTEYDYFQSRRADGTGGDRFARALRENHVGLYVADGWQITDPLKIELGVRYDRYTQTDEGLFSPRLNLLYSVGGKGAFRFAVGRFLQSQRPYELQVEDGVIDFFPVETAEHWILGWERQFRTHRSGSDLALRVEAYHRDVDNPRSRYENLYEPLNTFPEVEPDRIRITPETSRAQGIEVFLKGALGPRIGWWLNYAWATTEDRIEGSWVPRKYDQPHTFNFDFDYRIASRWRLNLAGRIHSGWPVTPLGLEEVPTGEGEIDTRLVLGPRNSERFPTYKRLDLRVSRIWDFAFGNLTFFVDIQNLLDSRNASGLDIVFDDETGTLEVNREFWVGFFPSAGVLFEFRAPD